MKLNNANQDILLQGSQNKWNFKTRWIRTRCRRHAIHVCSMNDIIRSYILTVVRFIGWGRVQCPPAHPISPKRLLHAVRTVLKRQILHPSRRSHCVVFFTYFKLHLLIIQETLQHSYLGLVKFTLILFWSKNPVL